jgi:transcriptional regulator with PAS, ATPase and Fis domain
MKDKPGLFASAEGGTILLDEIGDVSPAFQVRLLRVLQERTYMPLGAVKPETTDVRVITASNKDIHSLVESGNFRKDLYYRINVLRIQLPALQDRKTDIPILTEHFIQKFNTLRNRSVNGISGTALDLLMSYDYPGNIRELENLIEHAFILCPDLAQIEPKHLPENIQTSKPDNSSASISDRMQTLEAQTIRDALERNQYNRLATARDLNIHKSTLFRKMKKLGLKLPKRDGRTRLL